MTAAAVLARAPFGVDLDMQGTLRLVRATVAQACRDALCEDPAYAEDRKHARRWLRSGVAAEWMAISGNRIGQGDIERVLECGCEQMELPEM